MDELAELEQAFLSPAKLAAITGCVSEDDLKNVKDLEMKVDSRVTSLSSLGRIMPGLESLKLPHSYIPTIRDLGTGYNVLTHLSLPHCHLRDISGIESLSSLAEVYFPYNNIEELSSLGMLDNLKVLDLEGNAIEDFEEIEQLGLCAALRQLMLRGNPVYEQFVQEEGEDEWRRRIKEVVKPVTVLDGWTVDSGGKSGSLATTSERNKSPGVCQWKAYNSPGSSNVERKHFCHGRYEQRADARNGTSHGGKSSSVSSYSSGQQSPFHAELTDLTSAN
ncbi:hypothetical protein BC832DRAFT_591173 [Gaertneriomyces semiglobifer]|nr:hypothetical protein BC832DRAFT_591173 [Gaertneriomyces semiglobifer]